MFGTHWMTRWHQSDADIPDQNMVGAPLKDPVPETFLSEFARRLRQKPKYLDLVVEPRQERNVRGAGLQELLDE